MKALILVSAALALGFSTDGFGANNLTHAYVEAVSSSKAGYESIHGRAAYSSRDHGGPSMQIVTDEIGYGSNAQARLLGSPLREVRTQPLCKIGGRTQPCSGRGAVVGYRRTWDASGHEGGNFEFLVIPNGVGGPRRVNFQVR